MDVDVLEVEDLENPSEDGESVPFHFYYYGTVYIVMNTIELDPFWRELETQKEYRELGILEKMLDVV